MHNESELQYLSPPSLVNDLNQLLFLQASSISEITIISEPEINKKQSQHSIKIKHSKCYEQHTSAEISLSNCLSACWWGQTWRSTALQNSNMRAVISHHPLRRQISNRARIIRAKLALIYEASETSENVSIEPREMYNCKSRSIRKSNKNFHIFNKHV